ncbi:MAG: formate hydrogenlyase maturation protein HycH [Coriobacteriia bacterium]|nr:formate hydrogenlyase maturation protein HycH [Coriobacteriia bacterium]
MSSSSSTDGGEVIFYQLSTKFVDSERAVPEQSQEVLYYALAVGHHTGVIDCLSEAFRCPMHEYRKLIEMLPEGSQARYKLEGILRHGEIQIDKNHAAYLLVALQNLGQSSAVWLLSFAQSLNRIMRSRTVYLMAREVRP